MLLNVFVPYNFGPRHGILNHRHSDVIITRFIESLFPRRHLHDELCQEPTYWAITMAFTALNISDVEPAHRTASQLTIRQGSRTLPPLQKPSSAPAPDHRSPPTPTVHLPSEIIAHILAYISSCDAAHTQSTLHACTLVSRAWHAAGTPLLYAHPRIAGSSFDLFVRTICPSKMAHHIYTPLAPLVRTLDLSALVHEATKSLTARLLGRLKGSLHAFVAPAWSFGINALAALSKCTQLRFLNLSRVCATIFLDDLLKCLRALAHLRELHLPRVEVQRDAPLAASKKLPSWPAQLSVLQLRSGFEYLSSHPPNHPHYLTSLSLTYLRDCHASKLLALIVIPTIGTHLCQLSISHACSPTYPQHQNQDTDDQHTLSRLLIHCPRLLALSLSLQCVTSSLFHCAPTSHPLQIFAIVDAWLMVPAFLFSLADISQAIRATRLPHLRQVWLPDGVAVDLQQSDIIELEDLLEDEGRGSSESESGSELECDSTTTKDNKNMRNGDVESKSDLQNDDEDDDLLPGIYSIPKHGHLDLRGLRLRTIDGSYVLS